MIAVSAMAVSRSMALWPALVMTKVAGGAPSSVSVAARREAWGRGYAPEAAAASTDWAFDHLGWSEVIHTIDPDNANSKTVAAKLGSTYLRMDRLPEPHHEKPVEVWGQTRTQWQARKAVHP